MNRNDNDQLPVDGTSSKLGARGSVEEPDKLHEYPSAPGVAEEVTRVVDHKAERRLCRRFDLRLLPILAIMCMFPWRPRLKGVRHFTGQVQTSRTDKTSQRSVQCSRQG